MTEAPEKSSVPPGKEAGEPVGRALSDYVLSVYGRRPTRGEFELLYWETMDAVERVMEPDNSE